MCISLSQAAYWHAQYCRNVRFYTSLPAEPSSNPEPRTFIVLPKQGTIVAEHFLEARNALAQDEVQAHTGMFGSKTNDGYYELGLATAQFIREAVAINKESSVAAVAAPDASGIGRNGDAEAHPEVSTVPTGQPEEDLLL